MSGENPEGRKLKEVLPWSFSIPMLGPRERERVEEEGEEEGEEEEEEGEEEEREETPLDTHKTHTCMGVCVSFRVGNVVTTPPPCLMEICIWK